MLSEAMISPDSIGGPSWTVTTPTWSTSGGPTRLIVGIALPAITGIG